MIVDLDTRSARQAALKRKHQQEEEEEGEEDEDIAMEWMEINDTGSEEVMNTPLPPPLEQRKPRDGIRKEVSEGKGGETGGGRRDPPPPPPLPHTPPRPPSETSTSTEGTKGNSKTRKREPR